MPTPLAEGHENSFAPQMIFLWPPARGVGKLGWTHFICGFRVAAKLAFSDWPWTPRGPKKGQKGPIGATHVKNVTNGLETTKISVVLPSGVFRIPA